MALQESQILDLINFSLPELDKGDLIQAAQGLPEYVAFNKLMRDNRVTIASGNSWKTRVMVSLSNQARWVGLSSVDNVNTADLSKEMVVQWAHNQVPATWEVRELMEASGAAELADLGKERTVDAITCLADITETAFWGRPSGPSDNLVIQGVPTWITYSATEGFNGGNATGFTSSGYKGGIDANTYTTFKNYTGQYVDVTETDLVQKIRNAVRKCNFIPAVGAEYGAPGKPDRGFYTNNTVYGALEVFLDARNENLGTDILGMKPMLGRIPLTYVPKLDDNLWYTDPFYGIDWNHFQVGFLKGDFMRKTGPFQAPLQHNNRVVYWDNSMAVRCRNPRTSFMFAKSAVNTN